MKGAFCEADARVKLFFCSSGRENVLPREP